jgi:hypothetical protein
MVRTRPGPFGKNDFAPVAKPSCVHCDNVRVGLFGPGIGRFWDMVSRDRKKSYFMREWHQYPAREDPFVFTTWSFREIQ